MFDSEHFLDGISPSSLDDVRSQTVFCLGPSWTWREAELKIYFHGKKGNAMNIYIYIYIYICIYIYMTINFDWRLVDTVLKLMPPWLVEVGRLLLAGSSSSWFGLWCPAHCSAAIPLLGAVFVAGFGAGVISALLWLVHLFRPILFPPL